MKGTYPDYRKKGITTEKLYSLLSPTNKKHFDDFIRTLTVGENKLKDTKTSLLQFLDIIEKPITQANLSDIREYNAVLGKSGRTPYTTNGIKTHVKRFLKFVHRDWPERFDSFKDLKQISEAFNEAKINEGSLINKEEIEHIMQNEKDYMKKTFFIALYESGLRPIELRLLKWNDIHFNTEGDISELHIYATKTKKARVVFVKDATHYLQELQKEKKGDYVFCSRQGENTYIKKNTATNWIKEIGKKHLKRDIFPYLLRHSRATELYLNMPTKVAQKFMGHKKDMSDLYTHLSSKDVKDAMLKTVYNLEELTPEHQHKLEKEIKELSKKLNIMESNFNKSKKALEKTSEKLQEYIRKNEQIIKEIMKK